MALILDDWQKEVLEYEGDLLLCTGRRVGKTYTLARKASDLCMKRTTSVIVVSLTEDQAMLIIAMAREYIEKKNNKVLKKTKYAQTLKQISFTNGSKIIARPVGQTGDSVRGFEADILIIDEASRMPERFWIAARPLTLTTAGKIWMGSTPHGKQGYFWEKFNEAVNKKDPDARFKVWYVTTPDVLGNRPISDKWTEEQKEKAMRDLKTEETEMGQIKFGQEYLGLFLDELQQFYPDELIEKAQQLNKPESIPKIDNFMGCDIARYGGDFSTYEVIHREGDKFYHIANHLRKMQPTTKTKENIIDFAEMYNCELIGIDAGSGSLGVGIYDELKRTKIENKVVAINNRSIVIDKREHTKQRLRKEDLHNNLRAALEDGRLLLLKDESIRASFKSIQIEYSEGNVRIWGDDNHIVEGLTRAYELARNAKIIKPFIAYI